MAYFKISDAYVPELESAYVQEHSTTKAAFWQSGIVENSALIASQLSMAGNTFVVPFNTSIEDDDAQVGSDVIATKITPEAIGTSSYQAIAQTRTAAYSNAHLAGLLAGNKPAESVRAMMARFWTNNNQKDLLASVSGVFADNANDGDDMTNDIYADIATPLAANLVSTSAIIDARHTMGDARGVLGAICLHSKVRKQLEKDEPNSFIPASESNIGFDTYLGMVVIEDDGMTVATGSNSDAYSTYLFGAGAIQYGLDARVLRPEEIQWNAESGNGMGEEVLFSRRRFVLHPQGFTYTPASAVEQPTRTDLALATKWDRVVANRKQIKIARLLSNAL